MKKLILLTFFLLVLLQGNLFAQENLLWEKHFGCSNATNLFTNITAVSDGIVAVGVSDNFDSPDWGGITGKGFMDAIIVKFDNNGNTVWKNNFGGIYRDDFFAVAVVPDGIVTVGISFENSFGTGDWEEVQGKGNSQFETDAIIVKYNNYGNVVWKKNFGSSCGDAFWGVTAVSDGIVAVGCVGSNSQVPTSYCPNGYANGDWEDVQPKGLANAIIVKYDNEGNVVWKKIFGGSYADQFISVTAVSDGIVAVGYSWAASFGTGDWEDVEAKGDGIDAIIVKYDNDGNVMWKKNYGGDRVSQFYSVTAVSDGIVAVGDSWYIVPGVTESAIVVKFDNDGNVVWEDFYAGLYVDNIAYSVKTLQGTNEVFVVGSSGGDYRGSHYIQQTLFRKYDNAGKVEWKLDDHRQRMNCHSAATVTDGFVVAGLSSYGYCKTAYIAKYANPDDTSYQISGTILREEQTALSSGIVLLYEVQSAPPYTLYDAVPIEEDGTYLFTEIPAGNYIIKAIATSAENLLPTYYESVELWEDATVITLSETSLVEMNITMISIGKSPQGSSGIEGEVVGDDGEKSRKLPKEGVDIYLRTFQDDEWITVFTTNSNEQGLFAFEDLPEGKYNAIVDIPGLPMLNIPTINLNDETVKIKFEITETGIVTIIENVGITSLTKDKIRIYPNPTTGELQIESGQLKVENVEIFDIYGKKILSNFNINLIDISELQAGLYFVKVFTTQGNIVKKVVKL
jgi:hypothetical protein